MTHSVTSDTSVSYISLKVSVISRVVIPPAYRDEDLAIQIIAATLVLFHQLRLEVSVPVSGNLKWNFGCVCFQSLWRVAVPGVPVLSPAIRFLSQMLFYFSFQGTLYRYLRWASGSLPHHRHRFIYSL